MDCHLICKVTTISTIKIDKKILIASYFKSWNENQENFLGNFILFREVEDSTIESKIVIWKSIKIGKKILIASYSIIEFWMLKKFKSWKSLRKKK